MKPSTEIQTERLILKGITPAFIHEMYNSKTKDEIIEFFGFDEQDFERFRLMHEKGMETYRISLFMFLIIHKESKTPIGLSGFHTWDTYHNRAELFYYLRKDSDKRQGYMTEALMEILDFGFNAMSLHRVEALVADWNTPSVKLLQKFGFTKEGTMREDYFVNGKNQSSDCYSLLSREWEG